MFEATLDGREHLMLPREVRERYGEHYYIVQLYNGIRPILIEDDPLGVLCTEFVDVERMAEEPRRGVRGATLDEAGHWMRPRRTFY